MNATATAKPKESFLTLQEEFVASKMVRVNGSCRTDQSRQIIEK